MTTTPPVLIATDLTDASDAALVRGSAHARALGAPFIICHVVPDVLGRHPLFPQANETDVLAASELFKRAAELVNEQVRRVLGVGPDDYTVVIENGNAEDEIVRIAEQRQASIVVIGAKVREGIERVLGRTAERVVRYAHVPVLVARPGPASGKILVTTDFSEHSTSALRLASLLMKSMGIEGTLLHVMQRPSSLLSSLASPLGDAWSPPAKSAVDQLEALGKTTLEGLGKQYGFAHVAQVEGEPADVIVARAAALGVEMILMGSRGRTGLARLVLGSTAEKVIRESRCSVLVTRNA